MIRKICTKEDIATSTKILQESFATVARQFNLKKENCSTNSAFITEERLQEELDRGVEMFGLYDENEQIGFVAIEKSSAEYVYYLEKLAVIPTARHRNYGKRLMDYACEYVKKEGGQKISIGIINENTILKSWYANYGFTESEIRQYPHLPFTVCIMKKDI
ncbi:MAG: GNAT family N-acetyltransferase [Dysgonomonas sp.]|nr:GNAT family N-acetyltransferase [Dysgonomonas sp.]